MNQREHFVRFPQFQRGHRIIFASERAHFVADVCAFDALGNSAFDGQVEPFLRARIHFESHARGITQNAHQADRADW